MLEERRRAFEAKFEHDQETAFRIRARRDKLVGLWAAQRLGRSGADAEAYAMGFVAQFGPKHDVLVLSHATEDLQQAGIEHAAADVAAAFAEAEHRAEKEIEAEPGPDTGR